MLWLHIKYMTDAAFKAGEQALGAAADLVK
jgi:hypothetical protein